MQRDAARPAPDCMHFGIRIVIVTTMAVRDEGREGGREGGVFLLIWGCNIREVKVLGGAVLLHYEPHWRN